MAGNPFNKIIHTSQSKQRKIVFLMLVLLFALSFNGCVYLVIGGIGAFGGYAASPDTVEGITSNEFSQVWDAAVEIVSVMGVITEQYEEGGVLVVRINGAKVTISIVSLSNSTTKLSVQARKAYMPKIKTSQEVYVKIMSYLSQ